MYVSRWDYLCQKKKSMLNITLASKPSLRKTAGSHKSLLSAKSLAYVAWKNTCGPIYTSHTTQPATCWARMKPAHPCATPEIRAAFLTDGQTSLDLPQKNFPSTFCCSLFFLHLACSPAGGRTSTDTAGASFSAKQPLVGCQELSAESQARKTMQAAHLDLSESNTSFWSLRKLNFFINEKKQGLFSCWHGQSWHFSTSICFQKQLNTFTWNLHLHK